ncbi:MAG TPA: Kazal-type serine protease inhibitor family protein [Patescibacteria group bacterium]
MKPYSAEESLWLAFPILLVLIGLVAGIIYLQRSNTDVRSRASEPAAVITPSAPTIPPSPEIICTQTYQPVCGLNDKTYPNPCEANLDGQTAFTKGACPVPTQIPLPKTP